MKKTDVNQPVMLPKGRYYDLMSYYGFRTIFEKDEYKYFQAFVNALRIEETLLKNFQYIYVFEYVNMQAPLWVYKYDISGTADPGTIIAAERLGYKDLEFSSRNFRRLTWLRIKNTDKEAVVPKYDRIISINIADFIVREDSEEYIDCERTDLSDGRFSRGIWEITIEIPKFNKKLEELETELDKWLFLFRNMPYLDKRPAIFDAPIFKELFEDARLPR